MGLAATVAGPAAGAAPVGDTFTMPSQPVGMAAVFARNRIWLLVTFPDENMVRLLDQQGEVVYEDGSIKEPLGIAVGSDALYVGSGADGRVDVFEVKGVKVSPRVASLGAGNGEFVRPVAIAVSPLTGHVYVADVKGGPVRIYHKDTHQLMGSVGTGTVTTPCGLTFNSKGELFVSDMMAGVVYWFLPDGTYKGRLTRQGDDPGETVRPIGLTVDAQDQVYVVDAFYGWVQLYAPTGQWIKSIGGIGRGKGVMQTPLHVVLDPGTMKLYVSDSEDKEIESYSPLAGQ